MRSTPNTMKLGLSEQLMISFIYGDIAKKFFASVMKNQAKKVAGCKAFGSVSSF